MEDLLVIRRNFINVRKERRFLGNFTLKPDLNLTSIVVDNVDVCSWCSTVPNGSYFPKPRQPWRPRSLVGAPRLGPAGANPNPRLVERFATARS